MFVQFILCSFQMAAQTSTQGDPTDQTEPLPDFQRIPDKWRAPVSSQCGKRACISVCFKPRPLYL
jgi:rubredoxin